MKPRNIKTPSENENALERLYQLMERSPDVDSDEGRELELLSMMIEQFEERAYPVDFPDSFSAIRFRAEQEGLKQKRLMHKLGNQTNLYQVHTPARKWHLCAGDRTEIDLCAVHRTWEVFIRYSLGEAVDYVEGKTKEMTA